MLSFVFGFRPAEIIEAPNFVAEIFSLLVEATLFGVLLSYIVPESLRRAVAKEEQARLKPINKYLIETIESIVSSIDISVTNFIEPYDHALVKHIRKFPNPNEELSYYDEIANRARNPFILQFFGRKELQELDASITFYLTKAEKVIDLYSNLLTAELLGILITIIDELNNLQHVVDRIISLLQDENNEVSPPIQTLVIGGNKISLAPLKRFTIYERPEKRHSSDIEVKTAIAEVDKTEHHVFDQGRSVSNENSHRKVSPWGGKQSREKVTFPWGQRAKLTTFDVQSLQESKAKENIDVLTMHTRRLDEINQKIQEFCRNIAPIINTQSDIKFAPPERNLNKERYGYKRYLIVEKEKP